MGTEVAALETVTILVGQEVEIRDLRRWCCDRGVTVVVTGFNVMINGVERVVFIQPGSCSS